ncbi:hypothetical protein [Nocardia sp. alder85J]|uniref:hypothetical protein n=1 Tax=Nocardia sp. alder85J TaxID=2862949 RepID=UPI001CD42101|nr:hypothetical protein [Nocardia sp. alder85J]MCX4097552.1 hypothetical protein [Nocardia sp. alder85J]
MKWMPRVFGVKELPPQLRSDLEAEGMVVFAPFSGSLARRNHRTALHYSSASWENIDGGTVALSRRRLVIWGNRQTLVEAPLGHPGLTVDLRGPEQVSVEVDQFAIGQAGSGWMTLLLRTLQGPRIAQVYGDAGHQWSAFH